MSDQISVLERQPERQLTQMDIMIEQAMRVEGLSGAERLALIDKVEGVYLRRKQEEAQEAFNTAMNVAQKAMEQIPAESLNPHTRSHYAKYAAVDKVIRPIYTDHGFALSFRQGEGAPPDCIRLICRVSHSRGHVEHPFLDLPVDGKGAQGKDVMTKTHATGSGVSYGKRYLAGMIFNLAFTEDDNDGNQIKPNINDSQAKVLHEMYDRLPPDRQQDALKHFTNIFKKPISAVEDIPASGFGSAKAKLGIVLNDETAKAAAKKFLVNDIQVTTLQEVIDSNGKTCKGDFLAYFKVKTIGALPSAKYAEALKWIDEQRRK